MIVTRTAVAAFLAALALVVAGCTNTSASHRASRLPPPPPPASPARDPYQRQVTATTFTLKLTGAGEVPPAARHGSAAATVRVKRAGDQVCWAISGLHRVFAPVYAYIHRGHPGTTGPVVIPLGGHYTATGCVTGVGPGLLAQIERHPGRYYLAIHNRQYPAGAVRAQL